LAVLDQYEGPLLRYADRILRDKETSRDIVQHVFMRLCDQSYKVDRQRVAAWLFTTCRNRALDLLRARRPTCPLQSATNMAGSDPDPAVVSEQHELFAEIRKAVDQLPPVQREAIGLWADGFSYREIAEITGCKEVSVRVQVHRGLSRLRTYSSFT
jgi:RNA polymerase sigma-70 factor (ECF subfamily)